MINSARLLLKVFFVASGDYEIFSVARGPGEAAGKFLREVILRGDPGRLGALISIQGEEGTWYRTTLEALREQGTFNGWEGL